MADLNEAPRGLIEQLKRLALFSEVVRAGSMSAAARRLNMSVSAVSQQVRLLEQDHGITLLHRSTRKLSLTDTGLGFAQHCQAMVDAAERAARHLRKARSAPDGELRVSAPVGLVRYVAPALAPLLAQYPALRLCLMADDARIDLIDERIDLALRGGGLPDAGNVARLIFRFEWVICAAPAYLAGRRPPERPADLANLDWIGPPDGPPMDLEFRGAQALGETVRLEPRVTSNNQLVRQELCVAGLGVTRAVRSDVSDHLDAGRLTPLLVGWRLEAAPLWAVTPQRDGQPAKVRHAIAAIQAQLGDMPEAWLPIRAATPS